MLRNGVGNVNAALRKRLVFLSSRVRAALLARYFGRFPYNTREDEPYAGTPFSEERSVLVYGGGK